MKQRMKKNKRRLMLLYVGSFLVSVLPLLICLIVRWDVYTTSPGDTVKLCFGGVMILVFLVMKALGKLHVPSGIVLYGVIFLLSYLLKPLLADLLLISGLALAGEILDTVIFKKAIRVAKERILVEKTADATTEKVEEVLQKYVGRC